jgi:DNA/RNA endonuclease YhcR with UshA esterase domain
MKKLSVLLAILLLAIAQKTNAQSITPAEVANHIGDTVTVCGKIFAGKYFDQSAKKITLLNMGAAYPKSPLTIVIDEENRKNFSAAPEQMFNGKEVCIRGLVKEFKGKPQIFIVKEADVVLVQKN